MCGRGIVYGELKKNGFAFDCVPRRFEAQPVSRVITVINPILRGWVNYFAIGHSSRCFSFINSAWQVVSVIVFNLTRGFQALTTAPVQAANRKRRTLSRFEHIQTLRYRFLNRAGLLIRPNGRPTLDVGDNPLVRERFESIDTALAIAA